MGKLYTETTHFGHKLGMIVSRSCKDDTFGHKLHGNDTHLETSQSCMYESYVETTQMWTQVTEGTTTYGH